MQCPFSISFRFFLLQKFKFACCLESFHLWIALNLLKYAFSWSYRTHVLPFYHDLMWYFSDANFCMTCFFLFLHLHMFGLNKRNKFIFLFKTWCFVFMVCRGRGGEDPLPARLKKFTFPFWSYALNYRPEKFFIPSFLSRKSVPQYKFWFQKVTQLVGQAFKQLIQRRRLTNKL